MDCLGGYGRVGVGVGVRLVVPCGVINHPYHRTEIRVYDTIPDHTIGYTTWQASAQLRVDAEGPSGPSLVIPA